MGCVVSLASSLCSATDHVVESERLWFLFTIQVRALYNSVSVAAYHRRVMRLRRVNRGPRGVSEGESAGHFQNVICMCHARQEGPFRQGWTIIAAGVLSIVAAATLNPGLSWAMGYPAGAANAPRPACPLVNRSYAQTSSARANRPWSLPPPPLPQWILLDPV